MSSNQNYSSRLLENAVAEFAKLPGIGNKTALRMVLYLLRQDNAMVDQFGNAIIQLKHDIKHCRICFNLSDEEICSICSDETRDKSIICVVENIRDVMSIENTRKYNGIYHVLGGIISPMDGIGPADLTIAALEEKVAIGGISEVIFALSTTLEGDTTNFYIYKKLKIHDVILSTLARGVSMGDELEYTDELTLGRSILNRTPFETAMRQT